MAINLRRKLVIDENFTKAKQGIYKALDNKLFYLINCNPVFDDITSSVKYRNLINEISDYVDYAKMKYIQRLNKKRAKK